MQFIASLTNTILSLSLTKRVKRRLILCNVLQLDFYLLPDFTVNLLWFHLWCQTLGVCQAELTRAVSVRAALISNMLNKSTFTF